jgi:Ser/Thr protein kinase RdoA (MazF antagonist)
MRNELERLRSSLPAWGELREVSSLADGHRNAAMLVERAGERFVAKTTRRSRAAIEWLVDVLIAANAAGFVVPRLIPSGDGRLVVEGVTLETWIEGDLLQPSDLARAMPLIREFHRLAARFGQRPGFASSQDLLVQDSGGDVELSSMPERLVDACRAAWRGLAGAGLAVVHGDLNRSNLLLTPTGGIGLVDWDESRVDVPLLDETALLSGDSLGGEAPANASERALLAWEVAVSWQLEPEYAQRLASRLG